MHLPATVQDLTPSWFSKMLNGVHIKPETFKLVSNIQEGIGFLSMMVRVEFEVEVPANSPESRTKYNLIVKLLPEQCGSALLAEARNIVIDTKLDQVEIGAYRSLLPDCIQEVPALKQYICEVHFGEFRETDLVAKIPYTSILVLEDLRVLGYTTKLYGETFTHAEFKQGIEFLATFHVACKSLEFCHSLKLPEIYPSWFPNWLNDRDAFQSGQIPQLFDMIHEGFKALHNFLEDQGKPELIPPYKLLAPQTTKMFQAILIAAMDNPCGAHMDMYSHNILVNTDPDKPIKVIDWQVMGYTDPLIDLAFYVLATPPLEDLTKSGICKALRSYFDQYSQQCLTKGLPLGRSYKELEKFFLTYGMGFALQMVIMGIPAFQKIAGADKKVLRSLELAAEIGVPEFLLSIIV